MKNLKVKKLIAGFGLAALTFAFTACGGNQTADTAAQETAEATQEAAAEATEDAAEEATEDAAEEATEDAASEATEVAEAEETQEAVAEEPAATNEAMVVDEANRTITIAAKATGYSDESSIHLLVNNDGGNAGKAFFTSDAKSADFHEALVSLGAEPGNNIALTDDTGTIEGTDLDVKILVDGKEYGAYDLITASEAREMAMRFGGNLETNTELATGCILCMESCPAGIASDSAYKFKEPIEFAPSAEMPAAGTDVTFVITVK